MKKIAVYPGSFDPWHAGHEDVLKKALRVFDQVIIAVGQNPDKPNVRETTMHKLYTDVLGGYIDKDHTVEIKQFDGLLADFIHNLKSGDSRNSRICAVIRGLRNQNDFLAEQIQQYHNEDLRLCVPTYFVISDRSLVHISSSAIKTIKKAEKSK